MRRTPLVQRMKRPIRCLLAALSGGIVFGTSCSDPAVQGLLLGGFQDLVVTFIDAVFLTLQPEAEATVTVQAITDALSMFC